MAKYMTVSLLISAIPPLNQHFHLITFTENVHVTQTIEISFFNSSYVVGLSLHLQVVIPNGLGNPLTCSPSKAFSSPFDQLIPPNLMST